MACQKVSLVGVILIVTIAGIQSAILSRQKRQLVEGENMDQLIDILGPNNLDPVDFVIILDRSKGMGRDWFTLSEKGLATQIIHKYAVVSPDRVRIAIVTFANTATTPVDYISVNDPTMNTKCNILYGEPNPLDDVLYINDPSENSGTNLKAAFERATLILNQGKVNRPNAEQVILVFTDGDYASDEDPISETNALKAQGTTIFAGGMGPWLKKGNVRELANDITMYMGMGELETLINSNYRSGDSDDMPVWVENQGSALCNNSVDPNAACFCDAVSGNSQQRCNPGYFMQGDSCVKCTYHRYKSGYGNAENLCLICPTQGVTQNEGSTSLSDCTCHPVSEGDGSCTLQMITDEAICDQNPNQCSDSRRYCQHDSQDPFYQCNSCVEGFEEHGYCDTNPDNCAADTCENNGRCLDSPDDFFCSCELGFIGQYCEINTDECLGDYMCENGGTCVDKDFQFECLCPPGFKGTFCQDIETTTAPTTTTTTVTTTTTPTTTSTTPTTTTTTPTTTSTTPTSTTTPTTTTTTPELPRTTPKSDDDDTELIIIIVAAAGGVLLIIIIVSIIICCLMYARRKEAEKEAEVMKDELNTLRRERESRPSRYRRTISKTISRAFSGIWKRKSLRGSTYDDSSNHYEGSPSAPSSRRPDILGSEAANHQDEMELKQQSITDRPRGKDRY